MKKMKMTEMSLRVLMVSAEIAPWAKVGGLADVVGALPSALVKQGVEVVVAIPNYPSLEGQFEDVRVLNSHPLRVTWGGIEEYDLTLKYAQHPGGFSLLLVDCPVLFKRDGIYHPSDSHQEYSDSLTRWFALCQGAVYGALLVGGQWDVIHAHDSHGALTLPMVREKYAHTPLVNAVTALSIHNLAYQGIFPLANVDYMGFEANKAAPPGPFEFYGKFNCFKAGIEYADGIHTVSPTYAKEIVEDEEFGFGLEGILWNRRKHLTGILNGIDVDVWNPATDPHIEAHYTLDDLEGKRRCKKALEEMCGWSSEEARPLLGMISRLTHQKGIDILVEALPQVVQTGMRVVVLGNGDPKLEKQILEAMQTWPDSVYAFVDFNEILAHQIQAGSDMFLMPSRFEPCGLAQMYAMRYGSIPIASRTGGLADTITSFDEHGSSARGFLFDGPDVNSLVLALSQAGMNWHQEGVWSQLIHNAMSSDFSWQNTAGTYVDWYKSLIQKFRV